METSLSKLFFDCAHTVKYSTVGNDVNYAFVEESKTLYIYFQGSSSVTDWIRNFLFGKRPYKDMKIPYKVHRGFLAAGKEVEDIIINKVTEQVTKRVFDPATQSYAYKKVYKGKDIIIVGYSHGGALAAFCHECVWFGRPDLRNEGIYGYGFEAPRIYAGHHIKKALKERGRTFKIIRTNNDLVTHCPPKLFKFCHVNKLLKVHGNTSLVKGKGYLPKCIKSHYPEVVFDGLVKEENKKRA